MNRSGQQSANMDAQEVPLEGLSLQGLLLELQVLERGSKWSHFKLPIICCAFAIFHLVFNGRNGILSAVGMASIAGCFLFVAWEQRNNERLRVIQKLLSELVARQDAVIQKLQQVNATKRRDEIRDCTVAAIPGPEGLATVRSLVGQ